MFLNLFNRLCINHVLEYVPDLSRELYIHKAFYAFLKSLFFHSNFHATLCCLYWVHMNWTFMSWDVLLEFEIFLVLLLFIDGIEMNKQLCLQLDY